MTDEQYPVQLPGAERERAVRLLSEHFARDHIDVDELERRLGDVYKAKTRAALAALTADLPAIREPMKPVPAVEPGAAAVPGIRMRTDIEASSSDLVVAIMGGAERKGNWIPPRKLSVFTMMGGVELDFREAEFATPVTEVSMFLLMAGAEIIVPPGIRVESKGIAIMGGFGGSVGLGGSADPNAPMIRINGFALMGGVDVKVRHSGESDRDARKRLKEERKKLKKPPGRDAP